jgi:hypothetical protein
MIQELILSDYVFIDLAVSGVGVYSSGILDNPWEEMHLSAGFLISAEGKKNPDSS